MLASHRHRQPAELDLAVDHTPQLAQEALDIGGAAEDQAELVAPEARDGIAGSHGARQPAGKLDEQLVAAVVAERIVDLLEAIEVDDRHRHGALSPAAAPDRGGRPLAEQGAVGQLGQRVMLGHERISDRFAAEPAADRDRDREQRQIQHAEPDDQGKVHPMQSGRDVVSDRTVRQVELEHGDRPAGRLTGERHVDLDARGPDPPRVVGVGVDASEERDDAAMGCIERLVIGGPGEPRVVVGEHDVGAEVANPQTKNLAARDRPGRQPAQPRYLLRGQAPMDWPVTEQRRDRGLPDEHALRPTLGQATVPRLVAEALREDETEREHRDEADDGIDDERAHARTPPCHPAGHSRVVGQVQQFLWAIFAGGGGARFRSGRARVVAVRPRRPSGPSTALGTPHRTARASRRRGSGGSRPSSG